MSNVAEAEVPGMAEVKNGCFPYLNVDGAVAAADFYKKAFAASVAAMHPVDDKGRTMHIHLVVNGSTVMLSDFYPEHGHAKVEPQGFSLNLQVPDTAAWFKRAVAAGAEPVTEPQKMFWGDIWAQVRDPFGVIWGMNQSDH